jgi:hypothetical protein
LEIDMTRRPTITPAPGTVVRWISKDGYNDGYRVMTTGKVRSMRWEGVGDYEPHVWTTDDGGDYGAWESLRSLRNNAGEVWTAAEWTAYNAELDALAAS